MQELKPAKSAKPRKSVDLKPADEAVDRFSRSLDALVKADETVGLAVSGGPDSLALLLLAAAARPGKVEVATVDHDLREGSRQEGEMVAALCERLGVPHKLLTIPWTKKPTTAIQEVARIRRYMLLGDWAKAWGIKAIATGHHADDQAETLLMRLVRGSGVGGLKGMRTSRKLADEVSLVRPLLGWSHRELADICTAAGVVAAIDPSNSDSRFERVRMRQALAEADWLNPLGLAKSATILGQADEALRWAASQEWQRRVTEANAVVTFDPGGLPREILRRIVSRIILKLKSEGQGAELRGGEIERLMNALAQGEKTTLRGVLCGGGKVWRFARAPARNPRAGG